jgi:steroid 5-alpha reductase family enzyme
MPVVVVTATETQKGRTATMDALLEAYRTTDALALGLLACALLAVWCWVASVVTGNYSQVDRLWSILPVLYTLHFAVHGEFADVRLVLMTTLVVLWGTRLTYNFARKGGYRAGGEDYRWPVLQARLGPVRFQLLNATFVAPMQNLLLLLLAVPAYRAAGMGAHRLGPLDCVATLAFLAFLVGETVADQQQWRFQCDKLARGERGEAPGDGFLASGLFRYSRHPNFFCEQGMWWAFYLFAVSATGRWLDWSIAGATVLTLLFQGSTVLTEQIARGKYPAYADYQRRTSKLLPRPPHC